MLDIMLQLKATSFALTGDTRKIFVSKTVDESHCSLGARLDRF